MDFDDTLNVIPVDLRCPVQRSIDLFNHFFLAVWMGLAGVFGNLHNLCSCAGLTFCEHNVCVARLLDESKFVADVNCELSRLAKFLKLPFYLCLKLSQVLSGVTPQLSAQNRTTQVKLFWAKVINNRHHPNRYALGERDVEPLD